MGNEIGTSKEVKDLIKRARAQHWTVKMTGGKHIQFIPNDKKRAMVITSLTSSDHRSLKNLISKLKQSGLNL